MPGSTPNYAIPYPLPTDLLAEGQAAIQSTAETVDTVLFGAVPAVEAARDQGVAAVEAAEAAALVSYGTTGSLSKSEAADLYGEQLLAWDRIDRHPLGPLNGLVPLIGPAYVTSGTSPQTVRTEPSTGRKVAGADATGYTFLGFAEPPTFIEAVLSFDGDGANCTLAWCKDTADANGVGYGGSGALDDLLHPVFDRNGMTLTLRNGGGSFDGLLTMAWQVPMRNDGTRYRVGVLVRGSSVTVFGPNGETATASDPRVAALANTRSVFWEPVGDVDGHAYLHELRAMRNPTVLDEPSAMLSPADLMLPDRYARTSLAAAENTWWASRLGQHPTNGHPSLILGGQPIRTVLLEPAAAGATSIRTRQPLMPGSTVVGLGATVGETVTVTGNPSPLPGAATFGYVAALTTPLAKSHPVGASVWGAATGSASIFYNKFDPVGGKIEIDQGIWVKGDVYVGGTAKNTRIANGGPGVVFGTGWSTQGRSYAVNTDGPLALDVSAGSVLKIQLNGSATSSTLTGLQLGQLVTFDLLQGLAGGKTFSYPSQCKFAGGSPPSSAGTGASKRDLVTFLCVATDVLAEVSRSMNVG